MGTELEQKFNRKNYLICVSALSLKELFQNLKVFKKIETLLVGKRILKTKNFWFFFKLNLGELSQTFVSCFIRKTLGFHAELIEYFCSLNNQKYR